MKKIVIGLVALGAILMSSVSASAFFDMSEESFYFDAVEFLRQEAIVVGYEDGSFGYDLPINRAELLKIVVEAALHEEKDFLKEYQDEACFTDVPAARWFTEYVCYAKAQGWIEGYADGSFRPAQNITFVEALKIVMEVFEFEYPASTPWYRGIVNMGSTYNLIPLTIDDFNKVITRAEMADMVVRKMKDNLDELDTYLGYFADRMATYESIAAGRQGLGNILFMKI